MDAAILAQVSDHFAREERLLLCRFLDAGGIETLRTLGKPASKKRQGAKSREAGPRLGVGRYGEFRLAAHSVEARHWGSDSDVCTRRRAREGKKRPGRV